MRQQKPPRAVRIEPEASERALLLASNALPQETGGILLGCRVDGVVAVNRFLEVADRQASSLSYRRRHRIAEAALAEALSVGDAGTVLGYVGEWHSHPAPLGASSQDLEELTRISQGTAQPIALIVLMRESRRQSWAMRGWVGLRGQQWRAEVIFVDRSAREGI